MRLRLVPPSLRACAFGLLVATAAGCSTSDSGAAADTLGGAIDSGGATDVPAGNDGIDSPNPHPGDPISAAALGQPLEPSAGFAALARTEGVTYVLAGASVLRWVDGGASPTIAFALDTPGLALAADATGVYAVDTDGTWYASTGGEVRRLPGGPTVQRLAVDGDSLVGALGEQGVAVAPLDLSAAPTVVASLGAIRSVATVGPGLRVVARDLDGFALVSGPWSAPVIESTVPTKLPASAVSVSGGLVVGVESGANLHTLLLQDSALVSVGRVALKGPGISVALVGALAAVADWDRVSLYDVHDPAAPLRVAGEAMGLRRALDVVALPGAKAHVRTLEGLVELSLDGTALAPELALTPTRLQLDASADVGGGSAGLLLRNTGPVPLEISGFAVNDSRLSLDLPGPAGAEPTTIVVEPNDVAFLEVKAEGVAPLEATLQFTTNEPGQGTYSLPVSINPKRLAVGDMAPNFLLPGTAGEQVSLGALMGKVIHVKLFNAY